MNNGNAEKIAAAIADLAADGRRVIVAIDGRCAAGKTTLAGELGARLGCAVFHMDDFFLRPEQRTEARLEEPGGNVDRERFYDEILRPLADGAKRVTYRPFDCGTLSLAPPVTVDVGDIAVVEGSYCLHPALWDPYGLRVFADVDPAEQKRRIIARNGANADAFFTRWIPLEEKYFSAFNIKEKCDVTVLT